MKDIKGCFQSLPPSLCESRTDTDVWWDAATDKPVTMGQDLNLSEPQCPPVLVSERCHGDEMSVMQWDIQQGARCIIGV